MEGLIPYLLHAIKKQRPQHKFRSFSNFGSNSNRSYRLLISDNESLEGSSHRRTVSEFQAPTAADLFEQRGGANEFARTHSRSYREGGGASAGAASKAARSNNKGFYPYQAANMKHRNTGTENV